jgi:hypothetical protein
MEIKREINLKALRSLENAIKELPRTEGHVGWFKSATYQDGKPVAGIAAKNEMGIHKRPFMRPTIRAKRKEWQKISGILARQVADGKLTVRQLFDVLGKRAADEIRETITKVFDPPLSPRTIADRIRRKAKGEPIGSVTKPLIATKVMIDTLSNEVIHK